MFSTKNVSASELARSILVPVVLGLVAGIAGALMAVSYLAEAPALLPQPLQIGRLPVPSSAPFAQTELAERLQRVNVPLYARLPASGLELAQRARPRSEAIGYAAVITSDGWLATSASVLNQGQVVAAVGGRLLEIKTKIEDARTGLVFLKIEAAALPVVAFEETETLRPGAPLYTFDENGLFATAAFAGTVPAGRKDQAPVLQDSDRFNRGFSLDRAWGPRAGGSAVLSADGDLAGILAPAASGAELFVPMHLMRPVLAQVFRGQAPLRATLGVNYLALEETVVSEGGFGDVKGVRLTGSRALGLPAARIGSAAAQAGLQEGDILLRVDGTELSAGRDLGELVAEMEPGDKIRFDVLKDGAERVVEVTLGGEKR